MSNRDWTGEPTKAVPVSADKLLILDSADSDNNKLVTIGTLPALGGDVVGPASATDNALVRFDSTTGKLIQNSGVTFSDTGLLNLKMDDNTSIMELEANHTTPANGQIISQFDSYDDDSIGTRLLYGQIRTLIQDPTNLAAHAEMFLGVREGGSFLDYIALNEVGNGQVAMKKSLNMEGNLIDLNGSGTISLASSGGDLQHDVASGGNHVFRIDDTPEITITNTSLDMMGNDVDCNTGSVINIVDTTFNKTSGLVTVGVDLATDGLLVQNTAGMVIEKAETGGGELFDLIGYDAQFQMRQLRSNGTKAAPTAVLSGDVLGANQFGGYNSVTFRRGAMIRVLTTENWSNGATGTELEIHTNPNTTQGSTLVATFQQDGNLSLETNNLIDFGYLESNAAIPADDGTLRLGNTETIEWRNPANDGNIVLQGDNLNFLALSNARGINLENDDFIRWDGEDLRRILNDTLGFQFSVEQNQDFRLHIDQADEYDFDAAQANWFGNNIVNVGYFESNAGNPSTVGTVRLGNNQFIGWRSAGNADDVTFGYSDIDSFVFEDQNRPLQMRLVAQHTSPADGQEAAGILFEDNNSLSVRKAYGQIAVLIENPTSGSERGEMLFQLPNAGIFERFIVLNEADDDAVTIEKKLQIADTIDFKKITIPSDPPTEEGRMYVKEIDANNNALFVKIKVASSVVEVRLS